MWLDSHCHLTADEFADDRPAVLARAREAGVATMLAIGSGYGAARLAEAADFADAHAGIHATAGVHPHEAAELDDGVKARLRETLARPGLVAVGECGLDYWYENSPRAAQREAFAWQVALARELGLPVSIHVRDRGDDAYAELLDLWRGEGRGDVEGVLHCYTGSLDFARRGLDAGLSVSFSGIVTFKKAGELREVARALPLDRLLVETDAPFLAPEGHRGKRNEPAWVGRVGETIAELHGTSVAAVAEATSRNARRLFRLPEPDGARP
ncbi:MAG TPA: TatD family hydrolase [Myxococcota bacterium]|nr:TatD family hydrolase [Myxococcota bacterium]